MRKILYYILALLFILCGLFFSGCGGFATVAGLWALMSGVGSDRWIAYMFLMFGVPGLIVGVSFLYTIYLFWKGKKQGKNGLFLKVFGWSMILLWGLSVGYISFLLFSELTFTQNILETLCIFMAYFLLSFILVITGNYILNFAGVRVKLFDSLLGKNNTL